MSVVEIVSLLKLEAVPQCLVVKYDALQVGCCLCALLALNTLLNTKQNAKYNFGLPGQECTLQCSDLNPNKPTMTKR